MKRVIQESSMGKSKMIPDAGCPKCGEDLYLFWDWHAQAEYPSHYEIECPNAVCEARLGITAESIPVFSAKLLEPKP